MKRRIILILFAALLLAACAAKTDPVPAEAPKITAPAETELSLRLPLGLRDDIARSIPAFAAGFSAADGIGPLRFTVESADADIAEGVLEDDGTLLVIAHGAGETKLTVTAAAGSEHAAATVSVKVRDARRTLILCIAGALIVVLLILLGRPVKKAPAKSEEAPAVAAEPEETTPTVIFVSEDETNDNPERS